MTMMTGARFPGVPDRRRGEGSSGTRLHPSPSLEGGCGAAIGIHIRPSAMPDVRECVERPGGAVVGSEVCQVTCLWGLCMVKAWGLV